MSKTRHKSGAHGPKRDLTDDLFTDSEPEDPAMPSAGEATEPLDPGEFEAGGPPSGVPNSRAELVIDPPTVRIDLEGPPHPDMRVLSDESSHRTEPEYLPEVIPVPRSLDPAGSRAPPPEYLDLSVAEVLESPDSWTTPRPNKAQAPLRSTSDRLRAESRVPSGQALPLGSRPPRATEATETTPNFEVSLPCGLLIVDENPAEGARRAAGLMTFGYTCRVVTGRDARRALTDQSFDVVLLDLPTSHTSGAALQERLSVVGGYSGPMVVTAPVPMEALDLPYPVVVTPASELPLAASIEAVRPSAPAEVDVPKGDLDLDVHVIRALVFGGEGGPRRGRIRSMSLTGGLFVQVGNPLPQDAGVDVELTLRAGHRADFVGRVQVAESDKMRIQLELPPSDERFISTYISEARDPLEGGVEPVRIRARSQRLLEAGVLSERQLARRFADISQTLGDNLAHQAFIQACLKAQQLEFAVRCYRELKKQHPTDERIDRYLKQVGTILGFYALRKDSEADGGPALPSSVRWTLGLFILAAAILWILATTLN